MKILIVEDEHELSTQLKDTLARERYIVEVAGDGEEALDCLFANPFDLVILDIMLPKRDGLSVLKSIRRAGMEMPVLMLSARSGVDDKIKGLDLGADDYLAKPFSAAELLARVRALLRRPSSHGTPLLESGPVQLNTVSRAVTAAGNPVELTPKEFAILEFLLYNKNRVVSRFSLAEHVWGDDFDPFTMSNYIDVHIKNLRRKIGDPAGSIVRTVRGVGYLVKEVDE